MMEIISDTNLILKDVIKIGMERLGPMAIIDMNNDGHIDIAGSRQRFNYNYAPIIYFNDGEGRFHIAEIGWKHQ